MAYKSLQSNPLSLKLPSSSSFLNSKKPNQTKLPDEALKQIQAGSASPSATSSVSNTVVNKPVVSDAQRQFTNSLTTQPPQYTPGADVARINAEREANVNAGRSAYSGAGATDFSNAQGLGGTSQPPMNSTLGPAGDAYINSFKPYMDAATKANTDLANIQSEREQAQEEARRQYGETLDTSGMLKGGAEQSANLLDRRNNETLSRYALQESAAARTAGVAQTALGNAKPLQIGDSYIDPSTGKIIYEKPVAEKSISEQYGTGSIGEYNFAKSQGYTGSFNDYQDQDANRKKSIAAAGVSGNGLTPNQINTTVNGIANQFDNQPEVQAYVTANSSLNSLRELGTKSQNPADDMSFIYAFAKIMDPNSVVREGEYKTVQDYAQSLVQRYSTGVKRVFDNSNFLTEDAKAKMLSTLENKVGALKKSYDKTAAETQRQIDDAYAGRPRQITNYSTDTPQQESRFDSLMSQITFNESKTNAYLPRATWAALSQEDKDALLAEAKSDGFPLLIKD